MKGIKFFSGVGLVLIFLVLFSFSSIITFITDFWWFKEVGKVDVFLKPFYQNHNFFSRFGSSRDFVAFKLSFGFKIKT